MNTVFTVNGTTYEMTRLLWGDGVISLTFVPFEGEPVEVVLSTAELLRYAIEQKEGLKCQT